MGMTVVVTVTVVTGGGGGHHHQGIEAEEVVGSGVFTLCDWLPKLCRFPNDTERDSVTSVIDVVDVELTLIVGGGVTTLLLEDFLVELSQEQVEVVFFAEVVFFTEVVFFEEVVFLVLLVEAGGVGPIMTVRDAVIITWGSGSLRASEAAAGSSLATMVSVRESQVGVAS